MESPARSASFVIGLDLGQASDFTAIIVNQWTPVSLPGEFADEPPHFSHWEHQFRHIQRFALKTPYPTMVEQTGQLLAAVQPKGRVRLIIDHTGVGRPVVDMFRQARFGVPIHAITITAGQNAKRDEHHPADWTVPKKDLVGALQAQFHQGRIGIARGLPGADVLTKELTSFRMKLTTSANLTFEAWRDGDHDDLVLAAGLAVWGAERFGNPGGLI